MRDSNRLRKGIPFKKLISLTLMVLLLVFVAVGCSKEEAITAFCGSASKPAMEEAAKAFEEGIWGGRASKA